MVYQRLHLLDNIIDWNMHNITLKSKGVGGRKLHFPDAENLHLICCVHPALVLHSFAFMPLANYTTYCLHSILAQCLLAGFLLCYPLISGI
jgi:hypothetical protein